MNYAALASEIHSDPLGLGYAAPLAAGNLVGVKALLDAATGPGAATVTLTSIPRDVFLLALMPAYLALAALEATATAPNLAIVSKWDRVLAVIRAADNVNPDPDLLALAVSDGILTQPQANAAYQRIGSRAEVLWGAGASPSIADLTIALFGDT